jgi:MurNAc alpha-1-phosphate uridylyltransferase
MKTAMILAAGRGERLRPYTDSCPKPLLEVGGKPLIFYHLEALASAGISRVVINLSWLGEQVEVALGDGGDFGLEVIYSREPEALETGGGIVQALKLLGDQFIVVNGDIFTDYTFEKLFTIEAEAHLVLVPNPDYYPVGDFTITQGLLGNNLEERHTFSGIARYNRTFFQQQVSGRRSVVPLLREAAEKKQLEGELYEGKWTDVGTLERWQSIR